MLLRKLPHSFSVIGTRLIACVLIPCALIGAAALLFLLPIPWAATPDGFFHLHRTRALAEAFQAGVFYPRLFPDFAFDYGYPVLNYYAPLSYYPAALLHRWGIALEPAVVMGLVFFSALTAWTAYQFLRCWTVPPIALGGTLLYLCFPYRLYDLFVRGALPEFVAFTWLPLIGLGMYKLLQRASVSTSFYEIVRSKYLLITTLGWSGLLLTHNLSALLALLATGIVGPMVLIQSDRFGRSYDLQKGVQRMTALALPIILGAGLAAFYLLPALLEMKWVGIGQGQQTNGYANHFGTPLNLFTWSFPYAYPSAAAPTVPVPGAVGVALLLLLLLCLADRTGRLRVAALLCLLTSLCVFWLLTNASRPLWEATAPVLSKLLFPWRWQVILNLTWAWSVALVLQWMHERYFPRATLAFGLVTGVLVAGLGGHALAALPRADTVVSSTMLTRSAMWQFDTAVGQIGTGWLGEFTPIWVEEQRWAISRAPTDVATANLAAIPPDKRQMGENSARITPLRDGYLTDHFWADVATPTRLIFHTFFWPAWQIYVNEQKAPSFPVSNLGLLAVDLPAGQYALTLRWEPTSAAIVGWLITGITWGIVLIILFMFRAGRWQWIGGWLLLGLLPTAGLLWQPQASVPTAVAANFGVVSSGATEVQLEAAYTAPVCAGSIAPIELYWFIVNPKQPLTTFVHVVDANGQVKTQHDGPLAGDYTPFERWWPGMFVKRQHPVPIPAGLAPGRYEMLAGIYLSADANTVLVPLDAGQVRGEGRSHRVSIGTLEVRQCH